jgi:MFS family permease
LNKVLAWFLFAQTLSVIGTAVTTRALPIAMLNLSGGTSLTGSVLAIAALPTLVITPILGVWAEKAQPRVLVGLNLVFAFASVVLAFGVNTKSVGLIVAALLVSQVIGAAFNPIYNRILAALTPAGQEAKVSQIQSIFSRLATALGEGTAPVLLVALSGWVFLVDAGSFVLSAAIATKIPALEVNADRPTGGNAWLRLKGVFTEALEGWKSVDKGFLLLISIAFACWMTEATVLPALPAAKPYLGALFALKGGMEFVTVTIMATLGLKYTNKLLAWSGFILGVSSLVLASSSLFTSTAAITATVLGAILSGIGSNVVGGGVWNRLVYKDKAFAGRVSASTSVATKIAEIVFLLVTTRVADAFSPATSFASAGTLMIVATLVVFGYFKPAQLSQVTDENNPE